MRAILLAWAIGDFCATCNRLRLTADGLLYPCLDSVASVSLTEALDDAEDTALESSIRLALRLPLRLRPERNRFDQAHGRPVQVMAYTGG